VVAELAQLHQLLLQLLALLILVVGVVVQGTVVALFLVLAVLVVQA